MKKLTSPFKWFSFLGMGLVLWGFSTQAMAQIPAGELPYNAEIIYSVAGVEVDMSEAQIALIESSQPDFLKKYRNIKIIDFPSGGLVGVHEEPYQADGVVMNEVDANIGGVVNGDIRGNVVVIKKWPADQVKYYKADLGDITFCQKFPNPSEALKEYQAKNCAPAEEDPVDESDEEVEATTATDDPDILGSSDPSNEVTEEVVDQFDDATEPNIAISQGGGCAFNPTPLSMGFSSFWLLTPLTLISLRFIRK